MGSPEPCPCSCWAQCRAGRAGSLAVPAWPREQVGQQWRGSGCRDGWRESHCGFGCLQPLVGVSGFSCSHTPLQCCLVSREAGMCGVPQGCCLWSEGCPELCPLLEQPERRV